MRARYDELIRVAGGENSKMRLEAAICDLSRKNARGVMAGWRDGANDDEWREWLMMMVGRRVCVDG